MAGENIVGLSLDTDFLNNLDKADRAMDKLIKKSNDMTKSVVGAFQQMSKSGVVPFVQELEQRMTALNSITNAIGDTPAKGFKTLAKNIKAAADETNMLINALSKTPEFTKHLESIQKKDYKKYEQGKFEESLTKYKKDKDTQASVDKHYHDKRQKELEQLFANEDKIERERYELWLMRKHTEEKEHRRIEESKLRATQETIAKQNAYYAQLETYKQQNAQAKTNSEKSKENYENQLRMYSQMFEEAAKREKRTQDEVRRYEQSRFDESLSKYRQNKEVQASVDKHYHDKRQREYEEMFRQIDRLAERERQIRNKQSTSFGGLYSPNGVRSIENMQATIRRMSDLQGKLNLETERGKRIYDELGRRIAIVENDLRRATENSRKFNQENKNLLNTADQLKRAFTGIFAVSAISGYVNKLVSIRGEFEMQHRSLQILIGDLDEANALWDKTIALAVKSPFRVKELVSYTKQLAAYRVEADKLYDVNKMLADVSSGLGVDMQRLILAYGQVKAANFLRGTELRQFSEAGVNMLEELSKLYTEIEGKTVSVGDVFDRVSKRLVTFEDVHKIFERITSEGGTFYKMQEQQSETLRGQIMNLRDSIDLMLNSIGEANEGVLKGSVAAVRTLVENWEYLAEAIKMVISVLALYKLQALESSAAMISLAARMKVVSATAIPKQLTLLQLLKVAYGKVALAARKFGRSMTNVFKSGNIWVVVIMAAAAAVLKLIGAFNDHREQLDEINKKYLDLKNKASAISFKFEYAQNLDEQKEKLQELIDLANENLEMNINIDLTQLDSNQVKEKFETLRQEIIKTQAFAQHFEKIFAESQHWVVGEDIQESFTKLGNASDKLYGKLVNDAYILMDVIKEEGRLTDDIKESFESIGEDESTIEYLERLYDGLRKIQRIFGEKAGRYWGEKYGQEFIDVFWDANNLAYRYSEALDRAKQKYNEFIDDIHLDESLSDDEKVVMLTAAIDKAKSQNNWDEFVEEYVKEWTEQEFNITFKPSSKDNKPLEDWQQRVVDAAKKLNLGDLGIIFSEENVKGKTKQQVQDYVKSLVEAAEKTIEQYKIDGQKIISEEEFTSESAKIPALEKLSNIVAIINESKKNGDDELQRLKKQISLIREAAKAYQDMLKTHDKAYADKNIFDDYRQTFIEAGLGDITKFKFGGLEEERENLKSLEGVANKVKGGMLELQRAISQVSVNIDDFKQELSDKKLLDTIEDMFGNYEVSLELEKLNIPHDLANQLFNVKDIDLSDIRSFVEKELSKAKGAGGRFDLVEDLEKQLEKVKKLEDKHLEENAKKYVKYLEEGMSNRIKIRIEELKKLRELEEMSEFTDQQKKDIREGIRKDTQKQLDIDEWEQFKESEIYSYMFEDLENVGNRTISALLEKLEGLKDSLSHLPADKYKEIVKEIEKLEKLKLEYNPFKALENASADLEAFKKQNNGMFSDMSYKGLEKSFIESETKKKELEEEIELTDMVIKAREQGRDLTSEEAEKIGISNDLLDKSLQALYGIKRENENSLRIEKERSETASEGIDTYKAHATAIKAVASNVEAWAQAFNGVLDGIDSILDAFGVAEDDSSRIWIESTKQIANMIVQVVMLQAALVTMGVTANAALGVIGIIGTALMAVGTMFSAIFQAHDKGLEKRIEKWQYRVERLQKSYETLEKRISEAYAALDFAQNERLARNNIQAQMLAYDRMIQAEKEKKKPDNKRIDEWYDAIADLREQEKELMQENIESFGGSFDFRSTTREFVDAWIDAFKETGNGLYGLQENFSEFFSNVIAEQAVMQGASAIMKPLLDSINSALAGDYTITEKEFNAIGDLQEQQLAKLDEFLEGWYSRYGDYLEVGEMSGLQRGIEGVSESTAQIIEALLNSMRFYVADSNTQLKTLVAAQVDASDANTPNPMLAQLQIIAQQTSAIYALFDSVVGTGHPRGRSGIRVFVD